jgi:N-acetyl-anhydromuramyl-L-alanine amidase AmpD
MPPLVWHPSRNFRIPSGIRQPQWIILHYTSSHNEDGDLSTLTSPNEPGTPSAHFLIQRDGAILWLVRLNDIAFHAGIRATDEESRERKAALSPNEKSIGIEICNAGPPEIFADAQYAALAWLLPRLCHHAGIPAVVIDHPMRGMDEHAEPAALTIAELIKFRGVLGHGNTHFSKTDPGLLFNWPRVARDISRPLPFGPLDKVTSVLMNDEPNKIPKGGWVYA